MTTSDTIQFWGIIIALLTSTISIVLTAISIKRTKKAAENAARAYLSLSIECFDNGATVYYIVLKNYGASSAQILSINYDKTAIQQNNVGEYSLENGLIYFNGTTVFPSQILFFPFMTENLSKNKFDITITYETCGKKTSDVFSIDMAMAERFCKFRIETSTNGMANYERNIVYSLQEIAERLAFK